MLTNKQTNTVKDNRGKSLTIVFVLCSLIIYDFQSVLNGKWYYFLNVVGETNKQKTFEAKM